MAPSYGSWQETSAPCYKDLSKELLEYSQDIAAGFPQIKLSKIEQDKSHSVFYDLGSEIINYHFCNILVVVQISPIHCGRGLHKDTNKRRHGSLRLSWG